MHNRLTVDAESVFNLLQPHSERSAGQSERNRELGGRIVIDINLKEQKRWNVDTLGSLSSQFSLRSSPHPHHREETEAARHLATITQRFLSLLPITSDQTPSSGAHFFLSCQ